MKNLILLSLLFFSHQSFSKSDKFDNKLRSILKAFNSNLDGFIDSTNAAHAPCTKKIKVSFYQRPATLTRKPAEISNNNKNNESSSKGNNNSSCKIKPGNHHFEKGPNSDLACFIGNSEGNRTRTCGYTKNYNFHRDPANWLGNKGSFSVQGSTYERRNLTATQADYYWLRKLRAIYHSKYKKQAQANGLDPNNALFFYTFMDLYTQSPLAATGDSYNTGFFYHLKKLKGKKISWNDMVEVRVNAFRDRYGRLHHKFGYNGAKADQKRRNDALKGVINQRTALNCN